MSKHYTLYKDKEGKYGYAATKFYKGAEHLLDDVDVFGRDHYSLKSVQRFCKTMNSC